jgi:far upstream element-binding protein
MYSGLIIGPKGSQQKQMSESTGAKILIRGKGASKDGGPSNTGHSDDNDELHVSIEGPEEAVAKATKEIDQIFNNPEYAMKLKQQQLGHTHALGSGDNVYGPGGNEGYQVELRVPNNMVGLIIGKQGENIIRIQNQLGVHAQVAKEHEMLPGETLRSIVLKGTPSNVQEAKLRIDEIINQQLTKLSGGNSSSNNDRGAREMDYPFIVKLPVPNDKVGFIIGKGGMNIKGIQERTRSNVQIPLGPDEENPQVRTLSIGAHSKEDVDAAQMEIFMTLQQEAAGKGNTAGAVFMLVPDDRVGIIIGKQGATIKDIQNRLRVRVQIPQQPDPGSMPPMRTVRYVDVEILREVLLCGAGWSAHVP